MPSDPKQSTAEKENLHPRNLHRHGYDFERLIKATPALRPFVKPNKYGTESINFSDPDAVKTLNRALLKQFYGVDYWDIPAGYLCPPIPGRADYIHYMADLLGESNKGVIPTGDLVNVLDIGTGANCVYPIIGNSAYGWQFVGTDIDPVAIQSANKIIAENPKLKDNIVTRLQTNKADVFKRVIKQGEVFDLSVCNPPFHASLQEAQVGTNRKWDNLNSTRSPKAVLNFGGKNNELWCPGGEAMFIRHMIEQSALFTKSVLWFSTLVSKKDTLPGVYKALRSVEAVDVKTISMSQGQKVSRIVAWTFLNEREQAAWRSSHWEK
ncbi:23S rRNA (adenine(1618)-N(6))-methyltransferase RlmF [Mucilaginibacter sp. X5P1]|uniref:23S rRNA (adenine(1618)-N(6))-methyltransferase RlmF n=1 Tax=Mucilaginibacter sp. X5P1 TaxID=2723088 RepID=UPI001621634C|nr:23S rRNA (adenine(1618)-N(6))-methyltransferase RlmF [Mucilaginibacter sp. X5P1]MBB6139996.1 23S rRNA (adenine1618-N6)-methyltransferase [Mucilaginibacter sp. X5P1]